MVKTAEDICNLAMAKLGSPADMVESLGAPSTPTDRHFLSIYKHYVLVELRAAPWRFAREEITLTKAGEMAATVEYKHRYELPDSVLRVIRRPYDDWKLYGREVRTRDEYAPLPLEVVQVVPEDKFDELFVETLACKLAINSTTFVQASASKKQMLLDEYKDAVRLANRTNAFETGTDEIDVVDTNFTWVASRYLPNA